MDDWIVHKEWKNDCFLKTNEKNDLKSFKRTWKLSIFSWTNKFSQRFGKTERFLYWSNDFLKIFFQRDNFIKRTILLRENERNKWKMNDNFENERNHFLDGFSNGEQTKWKVKRAHLYTVLCDVAAIDSCSISP